MFVTESLKKFFNLNRRVSTKLDKSVFGSLALDGRISAGQKFHEFLEPGMKVCDLGGGKRPAIDLGTKVKLGLSVCGFDINEQELRSAPAGLYDEIIVADLMGPVDKRYNGRFDLIITMAALEHVEDQETAWSNMASMLSSTGKIFAFMPCRHAVFARLNLVLPESLKVSLLNFFYASLDGISGFKAFYNKCSPCEIESISRVNNLEVEKIERFYASGYFQFFIFFHIIWRSWAFLFYLINKNRYCESFIFVAHKKS